MSSLPIQSSRMGAKLRRALLNFMYLKDISVTVLYAFSLNFLGFFCKYSILIGFHDVFVFRSPVSSDRLENCY